MAWASTHKHLPPVAFMVALNLYLMQQSLGDGFGCVNSQKSEDPPG